MGGAETKVKDMNDLQVRLRDARKACSDDGFNGEFCQVFNDAIDYITHIENKLNETMKLVIDCGDLIRDVNMYIDTRASSLYLRLFNAVEKDAEQ